MEAESVEKEVQMKKHRKRMKGVFCKIREQMEFYFSDSNLHRDRFMKKQITENEDGYVDLSVFLNFNKIKAITTDLSVIGKALSHSKLLQMSDDGQKVKRVVPVSEPQQLDDRTVYVECLPHQVDHDWIKRVFSSCGKVAYVSLPRYKSTGDTKGFAFVEFESVEEAKKACEELNNPPVDVEERPGKFPKTRKQLTQLQRKLGDVKAEDIEISEEQAGQTESNKDQMESPTKLSKKQKKRRRHTSESSVDGTTSELSPVKRRKTVSSTESDREPSKTETDRTSSHDIDKDKEDEDVKKQKRGKKRKQKSRIESTTDSEADTSKDGETLDKSLEGNESKKKQTCGVKKEDIHKEGHQGGGSSEEGSRKRRKDSGIGSDGCKDDFELPVKRRKGEGTPVKDSKEIKTESSAKKRKRRKKKKQKEKDIPELRVISKKDWLQLRAEYLSLQKQSMTNLKKTINKLQPPKDQPKVDRKKTGNGKSTSTKDSIDLYNTTGNLETVEKCISETKDKKSEVKPKIEFVADVIVKVSSGHAFTRKELKDYLGPDVDVAYIDVRDGDKDGYIRFKNSDGALKLSESSSGSFFFTLVKGEEEQKYWAKLEADRDTKLNSKNKPKRRGAQKLIDKAQKINKENVERKHIVFTD